ncbi:SIMPL domain-containing protein [Georgenia sp. SYP-B2076]|uniref:SIMPL domain-containing protein n=1 Tax=Georgenia sp. SYP-B2076 TaxID=2495881 RepID=UPI000F8F33A8|nr:SIMPL domain-containing protein [Georgenia sp. SYP-B2076]
MPATIAVTGQFLVRHDAERGTVRLSVALEGSSRDDVVERAARLHGEMGRQLGALHDPAAGPVTSWSSDQLRVWGQRPWNQEGRQLPVVYYAAAGVAATFVDVAVLSSWLTEISLLDGITVDGVTWGLTEDTLAAITDEARRGAIAAAAHKAAVYAESLGLSRVRATALSDPGLLEHDDGPSPKGAARLSAFAADASRPGGFTLRPEEITVEVVVHARFAAE